MRNLNKLENPSTINPSAGANPLINEAVNESKFVFSSVSLESKLSAVLSNESPKKVADSNDIPESPSACCTTSRFLARRVRVLISRVSTMFNLSKASVKLLEASSPRRRATKTSFAAPSWPQLEAIFSAVSPVICASACRLSPPVLAARSMSANTRVNTPRACSAGIPTEASAVAIPTI